MEGNWVYQSNTKAVSFLERNGCLLIEDFKPLYAENWDLDWVQTAQIPIYRVSGGIAKGLSFWQFNRLLKDNNLHISQQ